MPPFGPTPGQVVQQGTGAILQGLQNQQRAYENLGEGIGRGVGMLGVGIFKMANKAKEEKEVSSIDDAIKASSSLGDPGATAEVLAKMQGNIRTERGKKYLLDNVERFRGTVSRLLDDKYKRAMLDWKDAESKKLGREITDNEVVGRARAWARMNPNGNPPPEFLGSEDAAKAIREEQDQAREIETYKAKRAQDEENDRNSTEAVGILRGRPASALTDEELYAYEQKNPKGGSILRGQRDVARRFDTTGERQRETADIAAMEKEGFLPVRDESGKVVGKRPNPMVEEIRTLRKEQAARDAKDFDARQKERADKAARGNVKDALTDLENESQAINRSIQNLMERKVTGEIPAAGFEDTIQSLRERQAKIPEEMKRLQETKPSIAGSSLEPPPEGPDEYDEATANAAGAKPDSTGHMTSKFKKPWNSRRILEVDGKLLDTMNDRPATQADVLDAVKQSAAHGRNDTVEYLRKVYDKHFRK